MRAWLTVMLLALAGCSVQVTDAPCQDDLQCPTGQRCVPKADDPRDGTCVQGARTEENLLDSCRLAMRTLAWKADQCFGGMEPNGGTADSHLTQLDAESVCASVVASIQKGQQTFVPEQFGACLRRLRETPCGGLTLDDLTRGNLLARCEALKPQAMEGGACGNNLDCQDGWCDTSSGCPGVCKKYAPAGGSCDGNVLCQPGSTCSLGVCRTYVGLNESCSWGKRCTPESDTACVDNLCVARKTSGTCKSADECATGYTCVRLSPGEGGGDSKRECRPARGLDEPCQPGVSECGGLLYCDAKTSRCQLWRESGQSCGDVDKSGEEALCLGSRCISVVFQLVCKAYVEFGQTCSSDGECGPTGACRNKACVTTWCR